MMAIGELSIAEMIYPVWMLLLPFITIVILGVVGTVSVVVYSHFRIHGCRFGLRTLLMFLSFVAVVMGLMMVGVSYFR